MSLSLTRQEVAICAALVADQAIRMLLATDRLGPQAEDEALGLLAEGQAILSRKTTPEELTALAEVLQDNIY